MSDPKAIDPMLYVLARLNDDQATEGLPGPLLRSRSQYGIKVGRDRRTSSKFQRFQPRS
jgi:hypothetical protein